jgi:hypothetical protein
MSGRRTAFVITAVILVLAPIAGLAENAASAQAKWPGPFDYIRQHPWRTLIGITPILIILAGVEFLLSRNAVAASPAPRQIEFSGSTFNAPVTVLQGDTGATASTLQNSDTKESPDRPADRSDIRPPVILYTLSPFLDSGRWEERVYAVAESVAPNTICAQFDSRNLTAPGVVVILVIVSCAQYHAIKKRTIDKLKVIRDHYPSGRVVLVAVGLYDEPLREKDGYDVLELAGYDIDQARFLICVTEEHFQADVSSQIRISIRGDAMQSLLDSLSQGHVGDQEQP